MLPWQGIWAEAPTGVVCGGVWDPSVWAQAPPATWSHMQEGSEGKGTKAAWEDGWVCAPSPCHCCSLTLRGGTGTSEHTGTKGGKEDALPVRIDNLAEDQLTAHFQVALIIC